ncbi:hypothetical protein O7621_05325 [Solwaraspora sp. WMMD937]|uniref:hypothetical protein n=1 Tax=Solwaraspora sp. WMMD937 TaxID=3016090 RepID=UPI00249C2214|nr:hypothetical protein [Solwaraspora sp. WMMD937]WFE22762.1 hypothetical protein O7621_05325 [Solwaraspora sp. WMMD937]
MPETVLDLIVVSPQTDEEDWIIYSPQIPGLAGGHDSFLQLREDLPEILRFAGVDFSAHLRTHVEEIYDSTDADYVIRVAQDPYRKDRAATANRLRAALTDERQRYDLLSSPRTRTGEVLFISAVASDTLSELAAQLHPSGDAAVIVCSVADNFIWTFHFTNSEELDEDARSLVDLGISESTTIGEIMGQRTNSHPLAVLAA